MNYFELFFIFSLIKEKRQSFIKNIYQRAEELSRKFLYFGLAEIVNRNTLFEHYQLHFVPYRVSNDLNTQHSIKFALLYMQ